MKTLFLVKKNPDMPSEEDNWIIMNRYEFALFIQTQEGKKRRQSFEKIMGCDSKDIIIIAECGEETAREWKSDRNRDSYIRKTNMDTGYTVFSYHGIQHEFNPYLTGEGLLRDESTDVEGTVMNQMLIEQLHAVLQDLSPDDRDLIEKLYLTVPLLTESEYAQSIGRTRDWVHRRKRTIFNRLKKKLECI